MSSDELRDPAADEATGSVTETASDTSEAGSETGTKSSRSGSRTKKKTSKKKTSSRSKKTTRTTMKSLRDAEAADEAAGDDAETPADDAAETASGSKKKTRKKTSKKKTTRKKTTRSKAASADAGDAADGADADDAADSDDADDAADVATSAADDADSSAAEGRSKKKTSKTSKKKRSKRSSKKGDAKADDAPDADASASPADGDETLEDAAAAAADAVTEAIDAAGGPEVEADADASEGRSRRGRGKKSGRQGRRDDVDDQAPNITDLSSSAPVASGDEYMIINDRPGDECRIAILEKGHLEELYAEREATATNVGNIYKGRVVNVEPAIQAAFIDYGQGANGFLHISDLHPRYFPGSGNTEKVGKKTPRRERPAIQDALKRGQEVLVQVLKEGIGSKGPTLTSYLSIPGRLLVMMPDMDRVGVSRKVEDDDLRREMRKVLDTIELPDGFGFILRTAGIGKTKTEIKRDVAYLTRLWKQIEKRIDKVGAPCALYTESDLVVRTVRDVLRPSIKGIIVDSQDAHERVSAFLNVVAPRSAPRVIRYVRSTPIFHAFDVERQIDLIHAREVPLKSGGALVIDQTEALVAIDVNSGRSRSARDSETNAYRTNCEAVDEICRQLRLRDLGGLIINDLIDMRATRHRKAIEERMRENLRRDRARTSIARISEFGLLEMTRQRMRPSITKANFVDCPVCAGNGSVQAPDSVGSAVVRQIAYYLDQQRVARLELVCSPRVASVLLSRKRRELVLMESQSGKRIDVRVSDSIAVDRVDYYAYDDRNSDLDLGMFQPRKPPKLDDLEREAKRYVESYDDDDDDFEVEGEGGKKRRRRRRRKPAPADATAIALSGDLETELAAIDDEEAAEEAARARGDDDGDGDEGSGGKKRRRRRRRRRRGGGDGEGADAGGDRPATDDASESAATATPTATEDAAPEPVEIPDPQPVYVLAKELGIKSKELIAKAVEIGLEFKSHMTRIPGEELARVRALFVPEPEPESAATSAPADASEAASGDAQDDDRDRGDDAGDEGGGKRRRRRRRRRRRGGGSDEDGAARDGADAATDAVVDGSGGGGARPSEDADRADDGDHAGGARGGKRSRRSRSGRSKDDGSGGDAGSGTDASRDTRDSREASASTSSPSGSAPAAEPKPTPKPRRRGLYRNQRKTRPAGESLVGGDR